MMLPFELPPSLEHLLVVGGLHDGQWQARSAADEHGLIFLKHQGPEKVVRQTYHLTTVEMPFGLSFEVYVFADETEAGVRERIWRKWTALTKAYRPPKPGPNGFDGVEIVDER